MEAKIEVFTSPTCPFCPGALRVAEEVASEISNVKVVHYDTSTRDGSKKAQQFGIMSVPTVFVKGASEERIGFRSAPGKKELMKAVNIALGKEQWPEKKGIFDKLRNIFS